MSIFQAAEFWTQQKIKDLAKLIRKEDLDVHHRTNEAGKLGDDAFYVGLVEIQIDLHGDETLLLLPCVVAEEYWKKSHGEIQTNNQLLMALIKLTTGTKMVVMNRKALKMSSDPNLGFVFRGTICHEVGHLLAGHMNRPEYDHEIELDTLTPQERERVALGTSDSKHDLEFWEILARNLMKGGIFSVEYDADRYAACLIGPPTMLSFLMYHMSTAETTGVRLEFQNRVLRHLARMNDSDYLPTIIHPSLGWGEISPKELKLVVDLLDEEEALKIKAEVVAAKKDGTSKKKEKTHA